LPWLSGLLLAALPLPWLRTLALLLSLLLLALWRLLAARLLLSLLARLLLARLWLARLLIRRRLVPIHFIQAPVKGVALHLHDLFQLPLDVVEDRVEIELIELLPALLAKLLQKVAQSLHALAVGVAHAALQQVTQRMLEVTEVHEVIGEVVEDVLGLERWHILSAVPHRIAESQNHQSLPLRPATAR